MGTVIEKNLAAEQDLLLGTGDVVQSRANSNVTVKALDLVRRITSNLVFGANSAAAENVDPAQYKTVILLENDTTKDGIFYWDNAAVIGGADSITKFASGISIATGLWIKVQSLPLGGSLTGQATKMMQVNAAETSYDYLTEVQVRSLLGLANHEQLTISVSGDITAASITTTGDATAVNVVASGNVSGVNVTASGNVSGVNVTASGNVAGVLGIFSGAISAATAAGAMLASIAEIKAGTAADKIMSPANFAGSKSLGVNGYYTFPSGLTIQWGKTAALAQGDQVVTFPVAFTTTYVAVVNPAGTSGAAEAASGITALTTTTFTFRQTVPGSVATYWIALGIRT